MWRSEAGLGGRTLLVSSALERLSVSAQPRLSFALLNVGVQCVPYTLSTALPTGQAVQEGVEMFRRTGATSITVLGNGSAIDTAKAIVHRIRLQEGPGGPLTRLLVIPTTISPVGCHDSWSGLHEEDDVLISHSPGPVHTQGGAATLVLFDPALLADPQASSSVSALGASWTGAFVSPLVSACYLVGHLVDSELSLQLSRLDSQGGNPHNCDSQSSVSLAKLGQLLLGAAADKKNIDKGESRQSLQQVEALCELAAAVGTERRIATSTATRTDLGSGSGSGSKSGSGSGSGSGPVFPLSLPLELSSQLGLLHSTRGLGSTAPWPFSWHYVRSLHALLGMLSVSVAAAEKKTQGLTVEQEFVTAAKAALDRVVQALQVSEEQLADAVSAAVSATEASGKALERGKAGASRTAGDKGKGASSMGDLSIAGAIEGLVAAQEELEESVKVKAMAAKARGRDIRADDVSGDDAAASSSVRMRLLKSDFFLDLANSATAPGL